MTDPTASRHFGMPVPGAIADHAPSMLAFWMGESDDLVEAHLGVNYAYFGAVDKSLSGFVVVDDEGDDFTLVDVRGSGQVWWQSHETRDLELRFNSFEEWRTFKREVDENDDTDEHDLFESDGRPTESDSDGPAPTSADLADRYQWLVWFLAQPLIHEGRPTEQAEDFASSGAGHYLRLWPNPEAERSAFEAELPYTAGDPHLAVYWLLHTGILAQDEYRTRLLAVLDEREQPEFVRAFRAAFGELALDGDVPVVPDFRERRALVQQYRCAPEDTERARAALRAMAIDPERLSVGRASWVLHALEHELLDADEVSAALVGAPITAGTALVRAELDRRAGVVHSEHAAAAMRMTLVSEDDWPARFWGFNHTFELVDEAGLLAEAGALALGKDPYVRVGLDMVARAHELGAVDAVLTAAELLRRRPLSAATAEIVKALKASPEESREILDGVNDPEVAEVLAQRLLCRADFDEIDAAAIEWAVTATLAGGHPDKVELAGRGLEQLPLDALESVVKTFGASVSTADSPLVPLLARLLERLPEPDPGDFLAGMQADDVKKAVFRILSPFAHEPVVFDSFMRLAAEHAPESTIEQLWAKLFNPFEEHTYLLPHLTDEQAERAARAMIGTMLEHPGIQARNSAGHQLYRFHHLGAQEFLLAALVEYGDRYADSAPKSGRELSHGQTEDDQLETVVGNLYSAVAKLKTPESRAALIERLWTERRSIWRMGNAIGDIYSPEVHVEVMRRLRESRDHLAAAYYAYSLDGHVNKRHPKVSLLAEITDWPLPEAPEVRRQFKYALVVGVEAALAAREFELVRTAYALAGSMDDEAIEPDALVRHRNWTNPLTEKETERALKQVLSGEADTVRRQLVESGASARAAGEPLVKITDGELEVLAGCAVERRVLADKVTGEIWFLDTEGEMHAFDGYGLTEPPFRIEPVGLEHTPAFLAGVGERTEHAVLWAKGAQNVLDLARYGERIAYQWGVNRGRLDGRGLVFDGSDSAAAAYARLKATAEAAKYTEHEPWYVPGKGAVKRRFYKPDDTAEAMAFDPATFLVDEAKARELEQWELAVQRDEGYALSLIETSTWDGYKVREDLTVEQWIKARIRQDGKSAAWHVRSLTEVTDYLAAHGFHLRLNVEVGTGVSEAEIAAFEAGRETPLPDQLRAFWREVGHASWSLNGQGMRILSPAESVARRTEVRAAGAALVAKLLPHQAESLAPVAAALDVLSVRPDGEPDLAFTAVPRSEEDDRMFVQLGGNLFEAWWERSLSWMFAVGTLAVFAESVITAAPETQMLFGGQVLGPELSVRRFEADTKNGRKFWEVVTDPGLDFVATRYGKLGSAGKADTKRCGDPAKAAKKAAKLLAAKEKQGYRELSA